MPSVSGKVSWGREGQQNERDMAKKNTFHVRLTGSGDWEVRVEGGSNASSTHLTQGAAVTRARELAKEAVDGKVVIHRRDGAIKRELTYGLDPRTTTEPASSKFKRCYISAPPGTNVSPLRHVLEERGVTCVDQGDLKSGVSLLRELEAQIGRSDFVCAVVPSASEYESVLFEMGVARGKGRPMLVFVDFGVYLPHLLREVPYSRARLEDSSAIEAHIGAFLEHSDEDVARGTSEEDTAASVARTKRVDTSSAALALMAFEAGNPTNLENVVRELFRDAGMVTSASLETVNEGRGDASRPDLTLWVDELQDFLGNPVLIEVKYGVLSATHIEAAEEQLRHYVREVHGQSGLLVYFDKDGKQFAHFSGRWPLIIRMSLRELMDALEKGQLAQSLASIRNRAVHGRN